IQALRRDSAAEALATLEAAKALLGANHLPGEEIAYRAALALARLREGDEMAALLEAESARHLIEESNPTTFAAFEGYAGVAEVYLALWEGKVAAAVPASTLPTLQATARQACTALREFARVFPVAEPRSWLWQGSYEWLAGSPQMAWRAWRKSLAIAQRLGMRYEEALARYEIGRHLPTSDPERAQQLELACETFLGQNATFEFARTQRAAQGEPGPRLASRLLPPSG
nr:serine/threonine-protein kinase PknK [Ardenticatenales bacterium]